MADADADSAAGADAAAAAAADTAAAAVATDAASAAGADAAADALMRRSRCRLPRKFMATTLVERLDRML